MFLQYFSLHIYTSYHNAKELQPKEMSSISTPSTSIIPSWSDSLFSRSKLLPEKLSLDDIRKIVQNVDNILSEQEKKVQSLSYSSAPNKQEFKNQQRHSLSSGNKIDEMTTTSNNEAGLSSSIQDNNDFAKSSSSSSSSRTSLSSSPHHHHHDDHHTHGFMDNHKINDMNQYPFRHPEYTPTYLPMDAEIIFDHLQRVQKRCLRLHEQSDLFSDAFNNLKSTIATNKEKAAEIDSQWHRLCRQALSGIEPRRDPSRVALPSSSSSSLTSESQPASSSSMKKEMNRSKRSVSTRDRCQDCCSHTENCDCRNLDGSLTSSGMPLQKKKN